MVLAREESGKAWGEARDVVALVHLGGVMWLKFRGLSFLMGVLGVVKL